MKTQTFKLTEKEINHLDTAIDYSSDSRTATIKENLDFTNNTVTFTDDNLEFIVDLLNDLQDKPEAADYMEILDTFTKQDKNNVIKEFQTNSLQLPII